MKKIRFKQQFYNQVLNREKISTLRYWKKCSLQLNENIKLSFGSKEIDAIIKNISNINLSDVTEEIAKKDGFNSIKELLDCLYSIYGKNIDALYYIEFEIN